MAAVTITEIMDTMWGLDDRKLSSTYDPERFKKNTHPSATGMGK